MSETEPRATLEHICHESGVRPKREFINRLLRFWETSTGEAQTRGAQMRQIIEKDKGEQP